ncbi:MULTISPECIES: alpha/beta fold hydrolase [Actinoalloteichus]|uniref:Hydrolase or acyltransferase of alpha/beta superfamily n=1 Tax=Actinoalloteichus fjordicus TaxID=1612552 RepID=A0AAC9LEZ5_9PSEU|nr:MULTISPECIES: alpha/beta fold hydrolase [Actinoalloteichus]APU15630.1 putative hydrolase or acyltransferase of alpha/beta superfamily [Actinoalloteichus fjordicus]APU21690.1 putative hydrolase or acyltransferase of alpha/beta superfamily [Actinoalloteichus sp. GBA129-24]
MSDAVVEDDRFVTAGDVELWTRSSGDPAHPTILLIAGDCQSGLEWPDEFVELLTSAGLRVLRYDHRDTGLSTVRDFAEHPYDFDDLASDAVAVLDGWGVDAAYVVGFGMGAVLGQLLAVDHRRRLAGMTLVGAFSLGVDFFGNWDRALTGEPTLDGLPTPHRWFVESVLDPQPGAPGRAAELDGIVDHWKALAGTELPFDEVAFRRAQARVLDHVGPTRPPEVHPHGLIEQPLTERGAELAGITTPTLVIQGPLDPISPPPHGRHLAEVIPDARFAEIPGMGHALPAAVHQPLASAIIAHVVDRTNRSVGAEPGSTR